MKQPPQPSFYTPPHGKQPSGSTKIMRSSHGSEFAQDAFSAYGMKFFLES
jgi:hypothetical protein